MVLRVVDPEVRDPRSPECHSPTVRKLEVEGVEKGGTFWGVGVDGLCSNREKS